MEQRRHFRGMPEQLGHDTEPLRRKPEPPPKLGELAVDKTLETIAATLVVVGAAPEPDAPKPNRNQDNYELVA